jgi:hypothetical protein
MLLFLTPKANESATVEMLAKRPIRWQDISMDKTCTSVRISPPKNAVRQRWLRDRQSVPAAAYFSHW